MMKIEMNGELLIEASAERVWEVLGEGYVDIGQWASAIPRSTAVYNDEGINGRVCSNNVPAFGDVHEQLLYFEPDEKRFGYQVVDGNPRFIKQAVNHWSVHSIDVNNTCVKTAATIEIHPLIGFLFGPLFKWQFNRLGKQTSEELKHFIETGQPHPRNG